MFEETKKTKGKKVEENTNVNDFNNAPELSQEAAEILSNERPAHIPAAEPEPSDEDLFAKLDTAGKNLDELTGAMFSFDDWKEGDEKDFIFKGMTTFTDKTSGEIKPAAKLVGRDGIAYIAPAFIIVKSLEKLETIPAPVRIRYNGKKKGTNGTYNNCNIFTL